MISHFLAKHGIKAIITLKILVLGYILIDQTDLIYIGEKLTLAQDDTGTSQDAEEYLEPEEDGKPKTFMNDLLTLPKISPDNHEKDELAKYFSILERKSRQLESRVKVIRTQHAQLKELEASIDKKLAKMEEETEYFKQTQQKEKEIKQERLASLVDFYKKMPAKKAAPVFERLDKDLVVALFNAIPEKQTMQILSLMNPDKSVEISEYYGRLNSAKEYEILQEVNSELLKEFEKCKSENL